MLNFFADQIIVPGISNLEDVTGRSCKLIIGSNPVVARLKKHYFSVHFRIGILEENARPTQIPRDEMSMSLTLDEAAVFCETLYNLAKRNSRTKDPIEIAFSGDTNSEAFAPKTFLKRSESGFKCQHPAMAITIEPLISKKVVAKVTLHTRVSKEFSSSALLSDQDALILSYIIRCGYVYAFRRRMNSERRTRTAMVDS
jgi:hypothetical protein